MRWAMRRAPSSGRARSGSPCWRSGPRERRPAGPSSCRTPARSWCFCCSTTAITLNLLRVFEVPAVTLSAFPSDSFGTGALAAFVATPCAGPFLGAALGTALLLPPAGSVAVFAALGFGLALPFLLIAFVPSLRRRLPKPGPWMAKLQRILAVPDGADRRGMPLAIMASRRRDDPSDRAGSRPPSSR